MNGGWSDRLQLPGGLRVEGEISFVGQEDGDPVMAASNVSTIDQMDGATSIIQSEGSDSEVDWDDA